jgi:hypothetical protein
MAARRKTGSKRAAKRPASARSRAAKKRVVKRVVRKVANKLAAKKRVVKRAVRKAGRKLAAKKRAVKRVVRKAVVKRVVRKAARRRAAKRVVRRAAPTAFASQRAGASAKDLLLFEIERARVAVLAAIQGLGGGTAMQPTSPGKWSIHEIVLHLAVRDRIRLEEFDSMLAGNEASWAGVTDTAEQAAENEAGLVPLRGLSWDDAVRQLMTTRAELLERLQAVPAEPAGVWSESHAFGAMMHRLPGHDRGHAEAIKNARIAG